MRLNSISKIVKAVIYSLLTTEINNANSEKKNWAKKTESCKFEEKVRNPKSMWNCGVF